MKDSSNGKVYSSVAVTGLEYAGKTAFIRKAFREGGIRNLERTLGIDVELVQNDEMVLQFFDLGGQEKFRKLLWQTYVIMAEAVIFILDSTDWERLTAARTWLWRIINDWSDDNKPILFLANKWDLTNDIIPLNTIIDELGLQELVQQNKRPFRIYQTSMLTGKNLDNVVSWLIQKINVKKIQEQMHIHYISFSIPKYDEKSLDMSFNADTRIAKVFSVIKNNVLPETNEKGCSNYVQFSNYLIVSVDLNDSSCILMVNNTNSKTKIEILGKALLRFVKQKIKTDPNMSPEVIKKELLRFVTNNFQIKIG